jgi:hypothetical protein
MAIRYISSFMYAICTSTATTIRKVTLMSRVIQLKYSGNKAPAISQVLPRNAYVHIDKIHMTGPLRHKALGKLNFTHDETLGYVPSNPFRMNLKAGTAKEAFFIQSKELDQNEIAHKLEIHCCPPKVLQKHNVFGHSSVVDYIYAVFDVVIKMLGITVDPEDRAEWLQGNVWITVIHLTCNFRCPRSNVLPIIQAIDENSPSGKHRDWPTCISLGFTPVEGSKHHRLTIYDKFVLLKKQWKSVGKYQAKVLEYVADSIRAEVKLQSMGLKARDLQYGANWKNFDVAALFFELFSDYKIHYAIQRQLSDQELQDLSMAEINVYQLWLNGRDVADQFRSRSSAWKYTERIKEKTGINISSHRRPEKLPEICVAEIFSPENVLPIPDWLFDTPFYFPPTQQAAPGPKRSIRTRSRLFGVGSSPVPLHCSPDRTVLANGQRI